MVYCECPFDVVIADSCPGEWTCDDIFTISIDMINSYDTNYDGVVDI
jgi:hypothetical protein